MIGVSAATRLAGPAFAYAVSPHVEWREEKCVDISSRSISLPNRYGIEFCYSNVLCITCKYIECFQ